MTVLLVSAFWLTSCTMYRGVPVHGASRSVSQRDLDAVVAATQKGNNQPHQLYEFRVVSRDEVWLYAYPPGHTFYGSYWIVKRVHSRWRCEGASMVLHLHEH